MRSPSRLIKLGVFGAPFGVKGEIRVKSYCATPSAIADYGALSDDDGQRRFDLTIVRRLRDSMVLARVDGVTTREAATALTNVGLFARRDQLPPPGPNEFYHDDLVGLEATTPDGVLLGRVIAVLNFGAGDILEIALSEGGETRLLPFSDAVAPAIDFDAGRIVVAPPDEIDGGEPPAS